jgi:hypothetical protein
VKKSKAYPYETLSIHFLVSKKSLEKIPYPGSSALQNPKRRTAIVNHDLFHVKENIFQAKFKSQLVLYLVKI